MLANAALTNDNTASAIVKRDASGNFTGGTITGVTVNSTGILALPSTSSSAVGVITQNGNRLIHSFGTNNFFIGSNAGNFTTTGYFVTGVGIGALAANSSGYQNTASVSSRLHPTYYRLL